MTASVVSGPTPESNRPPARYSQSPRKAKVRRFEAASRLHCMQKQVPCRFEPCPAASHPSSSGCNSTAEPLGYFNGGKVRATPEIVYHARAFALRCCRRGGHRQHRDIPLGHPQRTFQCAPRRRQPSPHRHLRAEHGSHGQRHQRRRTEGPSTQGRGWILGSSQQLTLEEFDRVLDSRGCDHVAGVRQHREFAVGQRTVGACGLLD